MIFEPLEKQTNKHIMETIIRVTPVTNFIELNFNKQKIGNALPLTSTHSGFHSHIRTHIQVVAHPNVGKNFVSVLEGFRSCTFVAVKANV